jgi:hypothetical protein
MEMFNNFLSLLQLRGIAKYHCRWHAAKCYIKISYFSYWTFICCAFVHLFDVGK